MTLNASAEIRFSYCLKEKSIYSQSNINSPIKIRMQITFDLKKCAPNIKLNEFPKVTNVRHNLLCNFLQQTPGEKL